MSIRPELDERLNHAREEGLVHITGTLADQRSSSSMDTNADEYLVVLNNLLRIRATTVKSHHGNRDDKSTA
ncbi:hypothetical protein [Rhizobium sp. MHM7A]|uniref:hypothetical protein n=1 Tax=Rhizobium sp. MHM7A TaxID=2583233 RepID=UPI001272BB33|nr:hypothetical protein [Rhizobium sp. MHM7A]TLX16023.1 hypothetical protein FFR93_01510 [Rhizobium sp. MHM7A]